MPVGSADIAEGANHYRNRPDVGQHVVIRPRTIEAVLDGEGSGEVEFHKIRREIIVSRNLGRPIPGSIQRVIYKIGIRRIERTGNASAGRESRGGANGNNVSVVSG